MTEGDGEASAREVGEALWNALLQHLVPARAVLAWADEVADTGAAWASELLATQADLQDGNAPDELLSIPGDEPDPRRVDELFLAFARNVWLEGRMTGGPLSRAIQDALKYRWQDDPERRKRLHQLASVYSDDEEAWRGHDLSGLMNEWMEAAAPAVSRLPRILRKPFAVPKDWRPKSRAAEGPALENLPPFDELNATLRAHYGTEDATEVRFGFETHKALEIMGRRNGPKLDRRAVLEALLGASEPLLWLLPPEVDASRQPLGEGIALGPYPVPPNIRSTEGEPKTWTAARAYLADVDMEQACSTKASWDAYVFDLVLGRVVRLGYSRSVLVWATESDAKWVGSLVRNPPSAPPKPPKRADLEGAKHLDAETADGRSVRLSWVHNPHGFGSLWLTTEGATIHAIKAAAYANYDQRSAFSAELFEGPDGGFRVEKTSVTEVPYEGRDETRQHRLWRPGLRQFERVFQPLDERWRSLGALASS